ncbi:o-succinylbenzoate synthase [Anabaenopsis tanganyikae CS-531]|uniref:o-succinylbenzoate synthase n=2 Tax=Anabaenopsis TaxID=110103 RepID=A0ABT5AV50_9CYAN|nr:MULTISPECIES: o-succinylbenzoate synthase [Anabaenopsis]MDB9540804.1 o-succinylbenzoate synthase [Anabaenopsis arnoldii]MDH6093242.1 o-succinylbenzoate synthase [Anabaenopsis arnoldii]MDH6107715.1 o-succinylbenzoate synthase [Anabaenopsis tanganyikae CS-531]
MVRIFNFDFRCYRRRFLQPLVTNHGVWRIREGVIIHLRDAGGNCGWGEIAPISWFGSETLEEAIDFCRQLPGIITREMIFSIPDTLPACQFAFESAWEAMGNLLRYPQSLRYSGLLPAGDGALSKWKPLWEQGYRAFKWKIGVGEFSREWEIFDLLTRSLPPTAKLRLDANGGLSYEEAKLWLGICDHVSHVEFLEQPLPIPELAAMLDLSASFQTAIALDESVATFPQLQYCFQKGWRGIFVIKPGIAGYPSRLRQFCQQHHIDAVFSSVFETPIGRQAALQLAAELSPKNRAVGFGVNHFIN